MPNSGNNSVILGASIMVKIVKDGPNDKTEMGFSSVMTEINQWPYNQPATRDPTGNLQLPEGDSRPFMFFFNYMTDENNPQLPDGTSKYTWSADPKQNIKIWEDGTPEPDFGSSFPADFTEPENKGSFVTFMDRNGADGKAFQYCVRLSLTGAQGRYSEPLDPRIVNSGREK